MASSLFDSGIRNDGMKYRWHCQDCGDHQGLRHLGDDIVLAHDGGWGDVKSAVEGLLGHHKTGGPTQHRAEGVRALVKKSLEALLGKINKSEAAVV